MDSTHLKIGQLLDGGMALQRDAIHIAVVPIEAKTDLKPGMKVILRDGKAERPMDREELRRAVGVVDPYLFDDVKPGERFWLFMWPSTVTSLRHDWFHPALVGGDPTPELRAAMEYLQGAAEDMCMSYDALIQGLMNGSVEAGMTTIYDYENNSQFWHNVRVATGRYLSADMVTFSCAC